MGRHRITFGALRRELKALTNSHSLTLDYRDKKLTITYYDKEFSMYLPESCFKNGEPPVESVIYDIETIDDIDVKDIVSREKQRLGL